MTFDGVVGEVFFCILGVELVAFCEVFGPLDVLFVLLEVDVWVKLAVLVEFLFAEGVVAQPATVVSTATIENPASNHL